MLIYAKGDSKLVSQVDLTVFILSLCYRHLTFSVKSLHKATYDMSQNFLDRYRLRALIVELIDLDHGETPIEDRNIDWLIDRYFEHILPRSLNNRIITDPSLEPDILLEPRHPRHVSHAEIRGYFASQAEWLLANQLASSSNSASAKLLDIHQWISFCLQLRTEVADAKKNGVKWGVPHKTSTDISFQNLPKLSQRLAQYGQTESFWAKKLENVKSQRKAGKTKHSKVSRRPHLSIESSWFFFCSQRRSISPEVEWHQTSIIPTVVSQFQYDSDFSEASTNASSDSEDEPFYPISKIPYFCLKPPEIPNGRFTWNCPGCDYYVDFLNLSPDVLGRLPDDTKRVLGSKSWKIKDEFIQRLLFQVVSDHYRDCHFLPNGVQATVQASGNEWYVEDRSEQSSKQRDWKRHSTTMVKEELIEDSMDVIRHDCKLYRRKSQRLPP